MSMMSYPYLLADGAVAPQYSSDGAMGLDLFAYIRNERGVSNHILPWSRGLISTGVSFAIPPTHYGRIAPRSGLALKKGIDVLAGVIDPDYRGVIGVLLMNLSGETVVIQNGDKIAQIIFERADRLAFYPVADLSALNATKRGSGGFGSTGA